MELRGTIYRIDETKTYGESFTKREFILYVENQTNSDWSDHVKFELIKDNCSKLDGLNIGDEINVSFNLTGRLWTNPKNEEVCFNSCVAWKVEVIAGQQSAPLQSDIAPPEGDNQDLPF